MTKVLIDRELAKRFMLDSPIEGDFKLLAIALKAKPVEPVAWQPIETAPRGGTEILVYTNAGIFCVVSYDEVFSAPWRIRNDEGINERVPTHWMPLPSAPPEHAPQVPLADAGGESTPDPSAVACPDWDMPAAAMLHLNDIEAQLGGSNGPTIRLRQIVLDMKSQLTATNEARQKAEKDAGRYRKLRQWMSSNVEEGWRVVEKLGAVAALEGWKAMDDYLDSLPECRVGLCATTAAIAQGKEPT